MTPEQSRALLGAVLTSIEGWIEEVRQIEKCCPSKVVHLRAAMEQAHMCLETILAQDGDGLP
jgi:hypothetical protein